MRLRFWLPILPALLIGFSAGAAQAGSFFGPSCYGANYAYQYPNRAHNVFGCGPCSSCKAHHPFFHHRRARRNHRGPHDGGPAMMPNGTMTMNGMPANLPMMQQGMPANVMMVPQGMAVNGMPVEYVQAPGALPSVVQAPIVQAPAAPIPAQTTSMPAARTIQAKPAVSSRIVPMPAPLPKGPASPQPSAVNKSGKEPF